MAFPKAFNFFPQNLMYIRICLPGDSHGQRSLAGYSPWGRRVRHDRATSLSLSAFLCHTVCSVQSLSCVQLFATSWTVARQASLSIRNSQSLPKLMSIESVMPSNHLILCHPLLLLPSIFPSIRVFSNGSALHIRWPKYWIFSFNISPSSEHPGLISFRMDWLDLLAVQGTLAISRGYSQSRDRTRVSCIAGRCFILWATREAQKGRVYST